MLYSKLKDSVKVDIMPALGTHEPMTREEVDAFLRELFLSKTFSPSLEGRCRSPGGCPAEYVSEVSEGLIDEPVPIEINKRLLILHMISILSIGQVVPHEVVGMANYTKNILVGCGGKDTINKSHMLGAVFEWNG